MSRDAAAMDELAIEGCTIRVRIDGQPEGRGTGGAAAKPVLVLSHMLGTDLSMWDGLVPDLTPHFRLVRYDTRGHGGSGLGDVPVSLERLGRDVLAILDHYGIERAHFLGCSMGGAVGLWLLVHAPERIERAVIADSAARLGQPAGWNARIAAVNSDGMEQAVAPTLERWFSPAFAAREPKTVEAIAGLIRKTPPDGYAACCAALRDMDLREAVRAVPHPVLVMRGADDPSVTAEDAAALVEAMGEASALELEARHGSSIEAASAFSEAVVGFLTGKGSRRAGRKPSEAGLAKSGPGKSGRAESGLAKSGPGEGTRAPEAKMPAAQAPVAKSSARRVGKRDVVAARRPVAQTAPVSGKAAAKASATRKGAARATPRAPEPSARRRAMAKVVPAETKGPSAVTKEPAVTKEAAPVKASQAKASQAKASQAKASQAKASQAKASQAKASQAKASQAKAVPVAADVKAVPTRTAKAEVAATPAPVAASRQVAGRGKAAPGKPAARLEVPARHAPSKAKNAKAANVKATNAKTTNAKATNAKAKPPTAAALKAAAAKNAAKEDSARSAIAPAKKTGPAAPSKPSIKPAAAKASAALRPPAKVAAKPRSQAKMPSAKAPPVEVKATPAKVKATAVEVKVPPTKGKAPTAKGEAPPAKGKAPPAKEKAPPADGKRAQAKVPAKAGTGGRATVGGRRSS